MESRFHRVLKFDGPSAFVKAPSGTNVQADMQVCAVFELSQHLTSMLHRQRLVPRQVIEYNENYSSLPPAVLVQLFECVQPAWLVIGPGHKFTHDFARAEEITAYRCYYLLGRVCRTFNYILRLHPQLHRQAVLRQSHFVTKPFIAWLARNGGSTSFTAFGQPDHAKELLADLLPTAASLQQLALGNSEQYRVDTLCCFSNLTSCQLHAPLAKVVDLTPLAALTNLSYLNLQYGRFSNLGITCKLTALLLRASDVSISAGGGIRQLAIRELALNDGATLHWHRRKPLLPLCTKLTRLEFQDNALIDHTEFCKFAGLPPAAFKLPVLSSLSISVGNDTPDLEYFSKLPALRALEVHVRGGIVHGPVACMHNLTSLAIIAPKRPDLRYTGAGEEVPELLSPVRLDFDLTKLSKLESVVIAGPVTIRPNAAIMQIAVSTSLIVLDMSGAEVIDEADEPMFEELVDKFCSRPTSGCVVHVPKVRREEEFDDLGNLLSS